MKKIEIIAGGVLGLAFVVFGLNFFLHFIPIPSPPDGSPAAQFMGAMYGSGFLTFVKVLEIVGGILVAVPRTRGIGLVILTPIVVNILAFHVFIGSPAGLLQPPVVLITVVTGFLMWAHRTRLQGLVAV
jgi:hypothetical protein